MKITAIPEFHVEFTKSLITCLLMCSMKHYDGKVKLMSRTGGVMARVGYHFQEGMDVDGKVILPLSFHDLDLLLKATEVKSYLILADKERVELDSFIKDLRKALRVSNVTFPNIQYETKDFT